VEDKVEAVLDGKRDPFVTVVMPVRNEGQFIARSVGAVLTQDYPRESMEVFVADGSSTDCTRAVVSSLQSEHDNLQLIDNPGRIVSTGLNKALRKARGEIIVRVDGHTIIEPNYVRSCVDALQRSDAVNVGGRMDPVGTTTFGSAVALATSSRFGVGGARFHYSDKEEWVDTVYLGAWPREIFNKIGLFDEEFVRNQDDEFNYRLRSRGGKILLDPDIKSAYYNRSSPGSLWRQYYQYGYWKVRVMQKHRRQMQPRQFAPFAFVSSLILLILAAPFWHSAIAALGVEMGFYALVNIGASMITVRRKDWRLSPLLSVTFAAIHTAYGCGFGMGLIRFANRWFAHQTASQVPVPETRGTGV
jgi:succinoglycan biosynthesis protein ExoA